MGDLVSAVADVVGVGPASKQAEATTTAANIGAGASTEAAKIQAASVDKQLAAQKAALDQQIALQEPWRQAGQTALNQLAPLAANYQKFGMDQFKADPGYAFRLSEGQKALERSAAMRGGLISGGALKAAQAYGQDMGSQEYTNAFNRYQTERAAQLNPLQSLAGVGQTAANQMSGAAGTYGTNASNALGNYGTNAANLALGAGTNAANAAIAGGNIRASQYGTAGSALNTLWNNRQAIGNWWNNGSTPTANSGGYENLEF
jgi:hypothetical protein